MPFSYYARLTRSQQASTARAMRSPKCVCPAPTRCTRWWKALTSALASEDRLAVQRATDRLIRGLTDAVAVPPVKVEVLAARPHAKWGELHGLYTSERGKPPKIQLWMRTAKQRRVVAFRTYLRTLLHEVGHHFDYALLRLPDSYHTEGFYKRESSLFKQLVPEARAPRAPHVEAWFRTSPDERLARLARTPDQLAALLAGRSESALARRPAPDAWAPVEIVCHLRDAEEMFGQRFGTILAMDDPILTEAGPADRWASDRQYRRHDAALALAHFRRRRGESMETLMAMAPDDWQRGGEHPVRGRVTIDMFVALMAWHDDNHVEQLTRAVEGRP